MSLNNYIRISALGLICLLSSMPSASAQWPTLDMSAIAQDIKSITQQVEQYKTQLMESKTVGSINSAIGDAKSSMSKFSTDDLEAAKKKAEKAKKKAEKLKKIQDDIKKAKEEYEEKKKQYEEYKQQLSETKEMVNDAKDVASSAGSLAGQATSDLKNKVSSVTGSNSSSTSSSSSPVASQTSSSATSSSSSVAAAVSSTANRNLTSVGVSGNASSPVLTQATGVGVASPVNVQNSVGSLRQMNGNVSVFPTTASVSSVSTDMPVSAVKGRTAFTNAEPISAEQPNLMPVEDSLSDAETDTEQPTEETSDSEEQPDFSTLKGSLNEAKMSVEQAKNVATKEGVSAGVATLKSSLNKAILNKDAQTIDAIANVDTGDIITSDSKIYQPETDDKLASLKDSINKTKALLNKNGAQAESAQTSGEKPDLASLKNSISKAETAANRVKEAVSSRGTVQGTIGRKAFTVTTPSVTDSISEKKIIRTLDKESSLWLDNGDRSRRNSVKLSYADTLVYGDAECTYKNFIVSADDGEIVILPKTLAKECCLQAEELKDLNVIKDCANKMLAKMNDSDSTVAAEAKGVFNQILAEQNLYGLAEALENTNASTSYQADVLKQYKEDMKSASTTGDDISSVSMTNTQLLFLLNRIRRIYTSALTATGITSLDSVSADTLNEETDIGIDGADGEYEFSVTRNEMEYPIIPENMAKKCALKISEGIDKVKDCYMDAVRDMNAIDFKNAEVGKNYVNNITYQNILDILAKSLYQRVKSAQYDEQLEKTKQTNNDATTIRTKSDGLFNTDYEIQEAIDDIVTMLASRVAHSSLTSMNKLNPLSTEEKSNSAQKEG